MIEGTIYELLKDLVPDRRVFASTFLQDGKLPPWPSIRYTIVGLDAEESICGTDAVETDDVRIQIDLVAKTHGAVITLRDQAIAALMTHDPPPARQSGGFHTYDEDLKVHRAVLDYVFQQSSE